MRIGINGFGRIGRMVVRAAFANHPGVEVAGINDLFPLEYAAYLLKHDSVHGRFAGDVATRDGALVVNDRAIAFGTAGDPAEVDWRRIGVDVVIEATGRFATADGAARHLASGAGKVIISCPSKDQTPSFVFGVNHRAYAGQAIISNSSCTTNCLAPLVKVLHRSFGIRRALTTTIHAATTGQNTVDSANPAGWRLGRGILENIIPLATDSARAVGLVIPEVAGRITGVAYRVPTSNVSLVEMAVQVDRPTSYGALCRVVRDAALGELRGVLGYTADAVVASDFRGEACSAVFDAAAGVELDSTFFKVVAWYDNETGYANRLLDMARVVSTPQLNM